MLPYSCSKEAYIKEVVYKMIVRKTSETYPFLGYRYDTIMLDLIITVIILESICKTNGLFAYLVHNISR